jgi:hypothetical protein
MGLLDFLTGWFFRGDKIECPGCGASAALETSDGLIHCRNRRCPNYDPGYVIGGRLVRRLATVPTEGNFRPGYPVSIRYINFAGQSRNFSAERDSLVRKKNQNLGEVDGHMPQRVAPGQKWPTGRERQILNYHKNHGTSSPRYEQLRAKYPNW